MSRDLRLMREAKRMYGKRPDQLDPAQQKLLIAAVNEHQRRRERRLAVVAKATPITAAQVGRGVVGVVRAVSRATNVPDAIYNERREGCKLCEFAVYRRGELRSCAICKCRFKRKLRLAGEQCAKGDPRYPRFKHLTPVWGKYVAVSIGTT